MKLRCESECTKHGAHLWDGTPVESGVSAKVSTPYYVKVYVNGTEWFYHMMPELLPHQHITELEFGYVANDTHHPVTIQGFAEHGKQLHTICRLDEDEDGLEIWEKET